MSISSERTYGRACAEQLRAAAALVEQFAPEADYRQQRDKTDVLRRLGLLAAALERHEACAICRRCQAEFSFDAWWFETRRMWPPRHCPACRAARRQERRRAGVRSNIPEKAGTNGNCRAT